MNKIIKTSIVVIIFCAFVLVIIAGFKLQYQIESRDMYIDYVNSKTEKIVNCLYEFDMREEIILNENAIKLLQQLQDIHPLN